ncbi:Clustered mitochondria protein like protein [Adhaeribacter pallidiroseus]|uniref:Clustered mitochondria protein like protein n=2 Tax=Adhaeribacter pallidiroseus TaxID=2072847 RepID=A0A369QI19_9BACT|nr:Clustered mitochondria protein like protein [Adhaeribacter pallidiroseus]
MCLGIQEVQAQNQLKEKAIKRAHQLYNQGLSLQEQGKYGNSIVYFKKASELYREHQQWAKKIDCDNGLTYNLYSMGKYNEALDQANQTLLETIAKVKEDSTKTLYSYINLGHVLLVKGNHNKALEYQQKALRIRRSVFGEDHPEVADSYHLVGNVYFGKGEYPKALEYHLKALQIRRATLNETHVGISNSYYAIGNDYFITGQYDKGLEYHLKALQIRRAALGEFHPDVANSFNSIGNNYHYKGEYDKALEYHQKALQIRCSILGEDHPSSAGSYNNIGNVYFNKGEYDKALEYHQIALLIRRSVLGENHLDVADSYHLFGNIYGDKGEYDKALEYYQKALQIRSAVLAQTHPGIASSHQTIGSIYFLKGEYDKALEYHQKSLQIRRSALGEAHPNVANSYNDIGNVFEAKENYEKALEYYQKALQIRCAVLGEKHPKVADSYYSLGNVHQIKKDFQKALEYYQMALQIRCAALGESHPSVADTYNQHGILYQASGNYQKATEYHTKALQSYLKSLGKTHPNVGDTYNYLGKVYLQKGDYPKALKHFQQAMLANVPTFQDTLIAHNPALKSQATTFLNSKTLLTSLQKKAEVLEKLFDQSGKITDLLLAYHTSFTADSLAKIIQRNQENETDKVASTANTAALYHQALSLCLKLHRLTQEQTYLDKAFYFSEQGKSGVLLASLTESKAKIFAGIPDSLLKQDQTLRNQIAQNTQRLAKELNKGTEADSTKLLTYQNQLFDANRQKENLVSQYERFYPKYYNLKYQPSTVTPEQLQRKLNSSSVVLEYALKPNVLQIFILGKSFFEVKSIPLDSLFDRQLTAFRDGIILKDPDLYQQVAHKLYKLLLPPAIPRHIKSLIIIPEGKLASFPFEALLTQSGKVNLNKTRAYLVHKYHISYAYSGRLLYERLSHPEENSKKRLLALAPVFADSALAKNLLSTRLKSHLPISVLRSKNTVGLNTDYTILNSESTSNAFQKFEPLTASNFDLPIITEKIRRSSVLEGGYVTPLIASEREVKTIGQLFRAKGAKTQLYLYHKATEDRVKSPTVSTYNYIHLATHGFVNENFPELSGLLLSQENTSHEDGILYTGEIYNLHLKADLVTLSACETGLGKLAQGEGVIGITRALLFAGAKNVLVSLWKVSDESTADLMKYFYQALLSGKNKTEALQTAKRKLVRKSQHKSPFYWAPFILIGQ